MPSAEVGGQSGNTEPHIVTKPEKVDEREAPGVASEPEDFKALRNPVGLTGARDLERHSPRLDSERGAEFGLAMFDVATMDGAGHRRESAAGASAMQGRARPAEQHRSLRRPPGRIVAHLSS